MTVELNTITDPNLPEPKGAAAAAANAVYIADGLGSGSWADIASTENDAELSLGSSTLNATTTVLTALDIYYIIGGTWTQENAAGMTTVIGTGRLVATTPGEYSLKVDLSVIASENSKVYSYAFMKNGSKFGPRIRRKQGTGTDVGTISLHTDVENVIAGDYFQICVAGITGDTPPTAGQTITAENAIFSAELIRV